MMLIATAEQLATRRAEVDESPDLQALMCRLGDQAASLVEGQIFYPKRKALLSKDGGVCAIDGTRLEFDPKSPHKHRCPKCGRIFEGERHHRAWVWRYHIWLSERAIHLALLGNLNRNSQLTLRAQDILNEYADCYRHFPNRDNVLGPTRLFFSTYLESIWLTQLIVAALMIEAGGVPSSRERTERAAFDAMVKESSRLIASFDEGWSNRQVWNNTALIAAGVWLGGVEGHAGREFYRGNPRTYDAMVAKGLEGPHGLRATLVSAVSDEGMWHEGENYHFFALRGFLLATELLRCVGVDLFGADGPRDRLRDMLVAPLLTLLPDLTLPARSDAPYGVSILQPRFAELWELGWARTGDVRLESILTSMYSADIPEGKDNGLSEISEQEQNRPAQKQKRSLLGWKALAWMKPSPPDASPQRWQAGSALLPQAGVAVLRTAPDRYVSVECGGRLGGHGHPDALHLTLFWDRALLMDFGTASYVAPSLFWYRSTLAHNAPGVSGSGQEAGYVLCEAFDKGRGWAWCRASAENLLGEDTLVTRTVVVGPNVVVDVVDVDVQDTVHVDLPIHLLDEPWSSFQAWENFQSACVITESNGTKGVELDGSVGLEMSVSEHKTILLPREGERLLVSESLGPPDSLFADGKPTAFVVRRASGSGRWIQCFGHDSATIASAHIDGESIKVEYSDGTADTITIDREDCRVMDRVGEKHRLRGARIKPPMPEKAKSRMRRVVCPLLAERPTVSDWENRFPAEQRAQLGAAHYRRSEVPYGGLGQIKARVAVYAIGSEVCFAVRVFKNKLTFRRADEPDPAFDNENPDIHSDGVQCYLGGESWVGYLLVPDPDSNSVRVGQVAGMEGQVSRVKATWEPSKSGYRMMIAIDLGHTIERGERIPMNLVVNEMYPKRERRVGQLVLSGGGGWVYLRGDREYPASALTAEVV